LAKYFRALLILLTVGNAIAVAILLKAELEKTFDAALRCFHTLIEVASNVCFWHFADIHADSEHVCSWGVKRTSLIHALRSAFDPKRTYCDRLNFFEGLAISQIRTRKGLRIAGG
jgi:hypothetical protein